jgi:hypothetical protein
VRNEVHTLADVVAAYAAQEVSPSEILVCVNGSTDGTLESARRLESEHSGLVRVLESNAAERKPGAWRRAFAEAANDLILFGDGDTLPAPQNGRVLIEAMLHDEQIAVVASAIFVVRPERPRSLFDWFSPDPFGIRPGPPRLQGAQYLLHRIRWQKVVAELNIPLMPDVVSEDGYLGRAVSASRQFVIAGERRSEAYIQPVATLREYNLAFCRFGHAGMQFDEFPPLRKSPSPPVPRALRHDVFSGILSGMRERDLLLITKALGTAWYTVSWRILLRYGDRLAPLAPAPATPSDDDLWDLRSAKTRFSRTLVDSLRATTGRPDLAGVASSRSKESVGGSAR